MLGDDLLAFGEYRKFEVGLGELAACRCLSTTCARRRRPGARRIDAERRVDDVELVGAEFLADRLASFSNVTSTSPMSRCVNVVVAPRPPPSSTGTLANSLATNSRAPASSLPPLLRAHSPRRPGRCSGRCREVFGFGTITCTPGLARSSQSLMPFGLPLRTRNTVVVV